MRTRHTHTHTYQIPDKTFLLTNRSKKTQHHFILTRAAVLHERDLPGGDTHASQWGRGEGQCLVAVRVGEHPDGTDRFGGGSQVLHLFMSHPHISGRLLRGRKHTRTHKHTHTQSSQEYTRLFQHTCTHTHTNIVLSDAEGGSVFQAASVLPYPALFVCVFFFNRM